MLLERRNSERASLLGVWVKEENGDYHFSYRACNISDEGIFLENRFKTNDQEAFSRLSFVLPNGKAIRNISAKMVREARVGKKTGAVFQFIDLEEQTRIELKKFIFDCTFRGTA